MHRQGSDESGGACVIRGLNRQHGDSPPADPIRWHDTAESSATVPRALHSGREVILACAAARELEIDTVLAENLPRVGLSSAEFRHLISNMIDDAVHAAPVGSRVEVRASLSSECGVRITVSHSGRGLGRVELERSFAPSSSSVHEDPRQEKLVTCRNLVRRAGGMLLMRSSKARGCELQILLPSAPN